MCMYGLFLEGYGLTNNTGLPDRREVRSELRIGVSETLYTVYLL